MEINQELIKRARQFFNLNIYEAKVWLALLSKGIASAGEISEISGVPRSRCYDVLESLEKEGFVIQKIGKPVKYIAIKPTLVIEKIKARTQKEAEEKIKTLEKLKNTEEYNELESLHNSTKNLLKHKEISAAIKGRNNINSHLREIIESAEKEVIICIPYNKFLDNKRIYLEIISKLKERKIDLKIALSNIDKKEITELKRKYNITIKPININATFFIIDRQQVFFPILREDEDLALWINTKFFSESLASLFELATSKL